MPVFVKIEDYKDVVDVVDLLKAKLDEAKEILGKINQLRNEEDSELNLWSNELEEINKKVAQIDKLLFEPETV